MKRVYARRRPNPPLKTEGTRGFSLGLNQQAHPTTIRNNELVEAQNVMYSQYGTVSKRPGSINIGAVRGSSTIIKSMGAVYEIGGTPTDYLLRISDDGILQKCDLTTNVWSDVSGSPTFSNVDTTILQAYGKVYLLNQTDPMRKWDGASFSTFTAIANPSAAPVVSKTGAGTGPKTYYYKYVWYNEVGNTIGSANHSIASMPETLDASTYAVVTLPAAPAGTVKTGIFKGTISGQEVYLSSVAAAETVYNDKGFDKPDPLYGVPTSNTTAGFHFYSATVYRNSLIGVTTELGKHTLVFSAGGDKFDSFGRSDGGGYYSWRKDDGDPITGVHAFQEDLYVFKRKKVGSFKFDEQGGAVRDINLALGGVSHRSIHAAGNDLRFWSDQGAMQLGNQPNFADLIRVQVMSSKAQSIVDSITSADFDRICGVYYKNLSLWGIPLAGAGDGNTSTLVFDERYLAWSEWTGLTPNSWVKFIDANETERLFYGDSQSGHVVECWTGKNDRGNAIVFRVSTKQFDMNRPHQYKRFKKVYFIFDNVTGNSTKVKLVEDGAISDFSAPLYADVGDQGFGVDQWGTMEIGDSSGSTLSSTSGLIVRYHDMENKDLFSVQAIVSNDGLADDIEFMGIYIEYSESTRPLPDTMKLTRLVS